MKKPLLVLTIAAAASPVLDAKTYSCGEGCYTDNSKASKGQAKLGQQIGYYTSVKKTAPVESSEKTEKAVAVAKKPATVAAPRAVQVARRSAPLTNVTPVASAAPRTNVAKASGRRTILEQELDNERNALAQAQKALADGRVVVGAAADAKHQSKVRQLESAVLDRQQNIQALQRELSRM